MGETGDARTSAASITRKWFSPRMLHVPSVLLRGWRFPRACREVSIRGTGCAQMSTVSTTETRSSPSTPSAHLVGQPSSKTAWSVHARAVLMNGRWWVDGHSTRRHSTWLPVLLWLLLWVVVLLEWVLLSFVGFKLLLAASRSPAERVGCS